MLIAERRVEEQVVRTGYEKRAVHQQIKLAIYAPCGISKHTIPFVT
jgi:hypothetical protein